MLLMFSVGVIFLATDLRFRDIRNRISEVLDSQPLWDIEASLGRLIGVVVFLTTICATLTMAIFVYGLLVDAFGFPIGTPIEPYSVFAFLVWDILPNLVLWGSMAILLSQLIKLRFLAVLTTLILLGSVYFVGVVLPFSVSSALAMHSGASVYPSELAPTFVTWIVLVNRLLMVVFAVGCLAIAALLQSRNQSTKTFTQLLVCGGFAILFALAGVSSYLIGYENLQESRVMNWTFSHKQEQMHSSTDIQMISGSIDIKPGRLINLDLTLTMESKEVNDDDEWLFSLNPGYRIADLAVNGHSPVDYTFNDGLLIVPKDDSVVSPRVRIVANGKPNERFAYLDSPLDWKELNAIGAKRLYFLGQKSYVFHSNFVALMPGISWIPASGPAYGADNLESRPRDFFILDVEVSVPRGWLVAAPGSRDVLDSSRNSTYRLLTRNPIPELALVSSDFEQRSLKVEGVEFEVLLNKRHTENLQTFGEVESRIEEWLTDQIKRLRDNNLQYPYSRMSLVEVPASLRTYGGGWRMGSVFSAPGIQMIRESGFPVAPFARKFSPMRNYFGDQETRFHNYMLDALVSFFSDDLHGGNPLVGVASNFVDYQTAPTGNGATALRYVVNQLASRVATKEVEYFSVHSILQRGNDAHTFKGIRRPMTFGSGTEYLYDWRAEYADRPSAWDLLEETPLDMIDYQSDPERAFHALLLKGQRTADAVIDTYGEERVGKFLNQLVERFRGRSYTEEDFRRTALDVGIDLEATIGDWLNQVGMAGFVVGELRNERLANDEEGVPVYQTSFMLSNTESVPGVVKVSYQEKDRIGLLWAPISLAPIPMKGNSSVRVAFQDSNPTQRVWIEPRLALNRDPIRLDFPELKIDNPSDSPLYPYLTPIERRPKNKREIVVDDLDNGFTIENLPPTIGRSNVPKWIEFIAAIPKRDFDRGLPVLSRRNQVFQFENNLNPMFAVISRAQLRESKSWWYRDSDPTSFGQYRKSYAGKSGGLNDSEPTFSTSIPTAGRWQLEYHIPTAMRVPNRFHSMRSPDDLGIWNIEYELGTYTIRVSSNEVQTEIKFDASTSNPGWNELGSFELSSSKVDVVLTEVSHGLAVADAIRWTPL